MPLLSEGDITIKKEESLTDFSIGVQPFTSSNQGHLYHDNKILLVSGGPPQKLAYIEINTL